MLQDYYIYNTLPFLFYFRSPSNCYVFYKFDDFRINYFFLREITNMTFKLHKEEMLEKMKTYLFTSKCRRRYCTYTNFVQHSVMYKLH